MANQVPNTTKLMLWKGQINLTDVYRIILMVPGFTFNRDAHHCYADVSASEVASAYGYTQKTKTLANISGVVNDTLDRCEISWDNVQWDASGGDIQTSGAIIINDSTDSGDDYTDAIISYKDAGGTITAVDTTPLVISSIKETLGDS